MRFANNDAAKGRDELCQQAAADTRVAWDTIRVKPCPAPATERHHRPKHDIACGTHNGKTLEQWQYEVTSGGRI